LAAPAGWRRVPRRCREHAVFICDATILTLDLGACCLVLQRAVDGIRKKRLERETSVEAVLAIAALADAYDSGKSSSSSSAVDEAVVQ
jgi:hypothetical protein